MLVRNLRDRELRANTAAECERVRQRHAAVLRRHLVRDEAFEPRGRSRARHLMLRERREIDDAHALAHAPALGGDMLEVVRAAEAPLVFALDTLRRKPVGALPAITLAPDGAHAIELVIRRARLDRAPIGALFIRKVNREDVAIRLLV